MADQSDPLHDAERQMAEHELALIRQLLTAIATHVRGGATTEDAMRAAIEDLIRTNPDVRELADRVGVLSQFRAPGDQ